jgi:hypothetical protein
MTESQRRLANWARSFQRRIHPTVAELEMLLKIKEMAEKLVQRPPVTVTDAAIVLGILGSTRGGREQKCDGSSAKARSPWAGAPR